jgi:hypothetical protein
MRDWAYIAGASNALRDFEATKCAGAFRDFLTAARISAIGRPIEAAKQIYHGTLFHPETGLYTQGLPRTGGDLSRTLTLPLVFTALQTKATPSEYRGEVVGQAIGNLTGSLLGAPLGGFAGQLGGGMLLGTLGRELGRKFDTKPEVVSGG